MLLNPSMWKYLILYIFMYVICLSDYLENVKLYCVIIIQTAIHTQAACGLGSFHTVPEIHGAILGESILFKEFIFG